MTTRNDLIQVFADIEKLLGALDGTGEEMTDRQAVLIMARAIWMGLDFLIRRTWGL